MNNRSCPLSRQALAAAAALLGVTALAACSSSGPDAAPGGTTTVTVTAAPSTPSPVSATESAPDTPDTECRVNPSTAPLTAVGPYETVPEAGRVSVSLNGIPSGTIRPGDAPTEVDVTVCNDSAVAYPEVGVLLVLDNCSCVPGGLPIAKGTVERFDDETGSWVRDEHPALGTGMDYLAGYEYVQPLPKGKQRVLRYRVALDASMIAGDGGVQASVVTPDPLNQIGKAELRFTVVS